MAATPSQASWGGGGAAAGEGGGGRGREAREAAEAPPLLGPAARRRHARFPDGEGVERIQIVSSEVRRRRRRGLGEVGEGAAGAGRGAGEGAWSRSDPLRVGAWG